MNDEERGRCKWYTLICFLKLKSCLLRLCAQADICIEGSGQLRVRVEKGWQPEAVWEKSWMKKVEFIVSGDVLGMYRIDLIFALSLSHTANETFSFLILSETHLISNKHFLPLSIHSQWDRADWVTAAPTPPHPGLLILQVEPALLHRNKGRLFAQRSSALSGHQASSPQELGRADDSLYLDTCWEALHWVWPLWR